LRIIQLTFEIINALGSLATFLAFVFLFRKDKDKQEQIKKLTSIASILEAQATAISKQNDLLSEQIDILRNTALFKGQDAAAMKRLQEIEERKLRLSVAPSIRTAGGSSSGSSGEFKINYTNDGDTATIKNIETLSEDVLINNQIFPITLKKGQTLTLSGRPKKNKHVNECIYELNIFYLDKLGNSYEIIIKGQGDQHKIITTLEK